MLKRTIVFDWGDTLMVNYPQYNQAMYLWPEVAEVAGACEALKALDGQYRLVLGTNAEESGVLEIRKALSRVHMDRLIDEIFTFNELGYRKPDLGFFREIEHKLDTSPEEMIMIGDSFQNDIMGAQRAGWKTIWYNPTLQLAPGLWAVQTGEIKTMADLGGVLKTLDLPDWDQCQRWLFEHGPSMRLWLHVQMVASAAYVLANWMKKNNIKVDPLIAQRGGMLHDICKLEQLGKTEYKKDHGELGAERLIAYRQLILSEISKKHVLNAILDPQRSPSTWEEKVVFFADKLAEGSHLVEFEVKINALQGRYPGHAEKIRNSLPALRELQREIASAAGVPELELVNRLFKVISRND